MWSVGGTGRYMAMIYIVLGERSGVRFRRDLEIKGEGLARSREQGRRSVEIKRARETTWRDSPRKGKRHSQCRMQRAVCCRAID
jgi:hypothetical protein